MAELIRQFELTGSTITLTTPDTCVICKRPATERYKVSETQRYHARISHKTGRLTWHSTGWKDVRVKLCDRHAAQVRKTYETPTPAVTPAKVRTASYQAAQMEKGQLSYWTQEQWYAIKTQNPRRKQLFDRLGRAIERYGIRDTKAQDVPLLPALTPDTVRRARRRERVQKKFDAAWYKTNAFIINPRYVPPPRTDQDWSDPFKHYPWGVYCLVGSIRLPATLQPITLPVWATMPDPLGVDTL